MEIKIKVSDFSKTPGARYYKDGKFSGEEFYDKVLSLKFDEAQKNNCKLIVDLDGTEGYATSFLDEAFRRLGERYSVREVLDRLVVISLEEPDWIDEITHYINQK